ncbi:MFS transporter [Lysobacteraceae bacterium NML93-0399]|nr:MFS transporter [Xanthomonadaceae bacterium NML93-0399]
MRASTSKSSVTPLPIARLHRRTLFAMSVAAGIAVANIYYNQPMLGLIGADLRDARVAAWIPMLTQLGYAAGLIALLPLGDMLERRRLIVMQFVALAAALALVALAPGLWMLAAGAVLVGALATVAQQIVPYAAQLATPERRGAAVGTVMGGLLAGILLSRTLAGMVSDAAGWRAMFWMAVPLALGAAVWMARVLPVHVPSERPRYGVLLRSLAHLWRATPMLRHAAITQALLFASFSAFWTTLALHLAASPLQLGASAAGAFGIVGAAGVAVAPLAGRIADRHGPGRVVVSGTLATALAWLPMAFAPGLVGLAIGVVILDLGVQAALVSNQHVVYGLDPAARSRLNTVFMSAMFLGGAAGSALAARAWAAHGWAGVSVVGATLPLLAVVLQAWWRLRPDANAAMPG